MGKLYFGEHSLRSLIRLIREALDAKGDKTVLDLKADKTQVATDIETAVSTKVSVTDIVNNLDSEDGTKPLSAAQGKVLADRISDKGGGDMNRSVYDKDDDGVVDKAKEADSAANATNAVNAENALKATEADLATNATKLGGVAASEYVQTTALDEKIEDAKTDAVNDAVAAVDDKINTANGIAGLDANGLIPAEHLPSYVDDVVEAYFYEGAMYSDAEVNDDGEITSVEEDNKLTGERSKIYIDIPTNASYRFGGTVYVPITSSDLVEISVDDVEAIWNAALAE